MVEHRGVDVAIMGREFRVACREEEREDLLRAVTYLDQKMREIRDGGRVLGVEKIAIMAALNLAHELLASKNSVGYDENALSQRLQGLHHQIEQALVGQEALF